MFSKISNIGMIFYLVVYILSLVYSIFLISKNERGYRCLIWIFLVVIFPILPILYIGIHYLQKINFRKFYKSLKFS